MAFNMPESLREGYENWLRNVASREEEEEEDSSSSSSSSSSEGEDVEPRERQEGGRRPKRRKTRKTTRRNELPPVDDPTLVHRARRATVVLPISRRVDSRHLAYVEHFETVSERFGVRAVQYRFAPAHVDPDEDVFEGFVRFITAVYDMIHREFAPEDFVQVDLFSMDLTDQRIGAPLVRVRDASRDVLLDTVENIIQSNFALALDSGDLTIEIQHVHMPEARGYENQRKHALLNMNENLERVLKESKSLAAVHPDMDPFCSVVSLLMGKQWLANKEAGQTNHNFRRKFKPGMKLRRQCRQLYRKAGLVTSSGVHLSEFE